MIVTKSVVLAWVVSLLMTMQPPKRLQHSYIPEAQESLAQTEERYKEIAEHYINVTFDKGESPLFGGSQARLRTLALALSIAYFESGFRRDVHRGIGKYGRGDGGRSWCLMQINLGKGKVPDTDPIVGSWFGKDLVSDTSKCARAGLHIMRRGMSACSRLPWQDRLSSYTSGSCQTGEIKARARMRFGVKKFDQNKPSFTDEEVFAALTPSEQKKLVDGVDAAAGIPRTAARPLSSEEAMRNLHASLADYVRLLAGIPEKR